MVVGRLPAGCGPAFAGILEELAAHGTTAASARAGCADAGRCTDFRAALRCRFPFPPGCRGR